MPLRPVAGEKIFIGGILADKATDFVVADFAAQIWVEIDGWSQKGEYGDAATLITQAIINRGRDAKQKGTNNSGQMQNVFVELSEDPGQQAMLAAQVTKNNYAIKVESNDAPPGSGATPTTDYFIGLVMNWNKAGGDANTFKLINSTIEINSNIVSVPPAP